MDLLKLDVNQCEDKYYVPNKFKATNKCDQKSSYVSIMLIIFCYEICNVEFKLKNIMIYFCFSVFLYWEEDSKAADTNANVNKDTNIHLKI